ncbi:MAG TPA: triphosphoribosyl-dephospho-CoA synthase, partial [Methanocorpusculum sp.]|nr:triphosphoribosyl-dephospho-CoA synthase [Methanocorpusculum sp.]
YSCFDTLIVKCGKRLSAIPDIACLVHYKARDVRDGRQTLAAFDDECIKAGINPGSLADICIAGIFTALLEGWQWDC